MYERSDMVGDGERCSQAGRLEAIQVEDTGDAVIARPRDPEILGRLARTTELGPDAGIVGLKAIGLDAGPEAPDSRRELRLRAGIHPDKATPSDMLPGFLAPPSGPHTTHFSIIDTDGNFVAATQTVNL